MLPHDRLRVLVPLADRGYSKDVVRDLATVLQLLGGRRSNSGIRLTLTGAESEKFSAVIRGPRLERLGARRIVGPADREEYSELFASHDVIWIPDRTLYLSQSSGKALDALVMGRPVIGFDGSWPATEASRWLEEKLTYRDAEGASRVLLGLRQRKDELRGRLAAESARIRSAYAPESTLLRVFELASGPAIGLGSSRKLKPLPAPPRGIDVRGQDPRWSQRGSLQHRMSAWILGARVARIGWLPWFSHRLRRQLSRVRVGFRQVSRSSSGR